MHISLLCLSDLPNSDFQAFIILCKCLCWGQICLSMYVYQYQFVLINWRQLFYIYILLNAIWEYDQTHTLLPHEHFLQNTIMALHRYVFVTTCLFPCCHLPFDSSEIVAHGSALSADTQQCLLIHNSACYIRSLIKKYYCTSWLSEH